MEGLVWFIAGGLTATVGAVAGFAVNPVWGVWLGALIAGTLVARFTKRLAAFAGAACVAAMAGGYLMPGTWQAVAAAIVTVFAMAVGTYFGTEVWEQWLEREAGSRKREARSGRQKAESSGDESRSVFKFRKEKNSTVAEMPAPTEETEFVPREAPPLKPREVGAFLELAARNPVEFQARLGELTAKQREQIRNALRRGSQ